MTSTNKIQKALPFLFTEADGKSSINKENLRWSAMIVLALLVAAWAYQRGNTVTINDARIASDVVIISSNRSGWISELNIDSGSLVKKGDLLIQIDDRSTQLAKKEIHIQIQIKKVEIERALEEMTMVSEEQLSRLDSQKERLNSAKSNANKAESSLKLAESNFQRSSKLLKKGLVSLRRWEEDELKHKQAQESYQQSKSALLQQMSELRQTKAHMKTVDLLDKRIAIMRQDLERLDVERQKIEMELADRQIRSPIDGVIDKTFGHRQEFISPGRRLIMLHNPNKIWINANIKETQLRHISVGMQAKVYIDAYPNRKFKAVVTDIDNATTSEFALLPNPNPSGNFTKVTQRLRIKLSIDQLDNLLKPGMMVEVDIDTRSAASTPTPIPTTPTPTPTPTLHD